MDTTVPPGREQPGFGALLKRYRLAAGLSQEALAERARLSARAISAYERGQRQAPYRDTVVLLAQALGLSPRETESLEATVSRRRGPVGAPTQPPPRGPAQIPPAPLVTPRGRDSVPPPLVGRAGELALLERHLTGEGPPVLALAGEPGIGKTHLLREAMRRAEGLGWAVLHGGCQRRGGHEPYAPILGAMQGYLRHRAEVQLRRDLAGCADLVRLLPELAAGPLAPLPAGAFPPEQERRLMVAAAVRFLSNVAASAGTLLLLDDLQWAGPDALELLMALVRSAAEAPVRVIGAYRDAEVRPVDALGVLLADLAHAGLLRHHTLGSLGPAEARELLAGLLEDAAGVPAVLRESVVERAGGVPFFVVSYARGLQAGVGGAIPWDLAQGLRQRVAALPAGAQEMLGVAAVVGRVVPRWLLATVLARPEDEVLAALDAACATQLLRETGIDTYEFLHDVIREVVEADLGATRRAVLHRRVAEALEGGAGAAAPHREPPLELLAFHYTQAEAWPKALGYLMQAGDKAAASHALQAAVAAYAWALEVCDQLGDTAVAVAVAAAQKRADIHVLVGDFGAAVAGYERMREGTRRLGDRRLEGLALVHRAGAEIDDHAFATAEGSLRAALAIAEEGYADVRLGALIGLVAHHVISAGRLAEAEALLQAAEEVAPQVQERAAYPPWNPASWRSWLANWAGRFDEAIDAAVHAPRHNAGWNEALARGGKGDYQRALALLAEELAAHQRAGTVPHQAYNTLGWIYGEIQNHDRALEWNARALTAAQGTDLRGIHFECLNHARLNLGDTLTALGRLDEAEEQFRAVEQVVRHPPDTWMLWRYAQHCFHSCGELWLRCGDAARALAYADECLQMAERTGSRKNIAKGRRLRGRALLAQGRLAEAEQELARALEVAHGVGNPPQLWQAHLALGDLRTAQGRPDEARTSYGAALATIDGVADALEDDALRETFLASAHVLHVRQRAQ
jgi:tetratricopeptide (TPR) repeat protein/transcriptional regulator with XRE-family HTH domain